jgi:hypothetical protein
MPPVSPASGQPAGRDHPDNASDALTELIIFWYNNITGPEMLLRIATSDRGQKLRCHGVTISLLVDQYMIMAD